MPQFEVSSVSKLARASRRWAWVASLCLLPAAQVMATPLTYNFSGVVTRVSWSLAGAVGDTFHGTFSFDSEPVVADRDDPFTAFSVWVDASDGPLGFSSTEVGGQMTDGVDRDAVQVNRILVPNEIYAIIVMQGGTAGYNPIDILSPLNLAGFRNAGLTMNAKGLTTGNLRGDITALELAPAASVPEPGTWALAALALAGLAGQRLQRMRRAGRSAPLLPADGLHVARPVG